MSLSKEHPARVQVDTEAVKAIVQKAGTLILEMRSRGLSQVQDKSSTIDLVTEADLAAEQQLRTGLAELAPEIEFWGEESNERPAGARFWVVDPIDGTTNFANGLSPFAVNVALHEEGAPVLGVTLELPVQKLYWAVAGQGAYVQDTAGVKQRLQVSDREELNTALLTTGFPYHRAEHTDNNLAEFRYFFERAQGVRCMGAAAMDLANVAAGALAGYWEAWLKPWDAAAGVLLVQEAGGKVTDYRGEPWHLNSVGLIASNGRPALHQALIDGVRTARAQLSQKLLDI